MQPLYVPTTKTEIRSKKHRYVHPTTGEVYGGTDYENPTKLAEIEAEPLRDEGAPKGYLVTSWRILPEEGGYVRTYDGLTPIPQEPLESLINRAIKARDVGTREQIALGFTYRGATFSMSDAAQRNWLAIGVGVALGMINAGNLPGASTIEETPFVFTDMQDVAGFLGAYASYLTDPLSPLGAGRVDKAKIKKVKTKEELEELLNVPSL